MGRDKDSKNEPIELARAREWRRNIEERLLVAEERIERLEAQLLLRNIAEEHTER